MLLKGNLVLIACWKPISRPQDKVVLVVFETFVKTIKKAFQDHLKSLRDHSYLEACYKKFQVLERDALSFPQQSLARPGRSLSLKFGPVAEVGMTAARILVSAYTPFGPSR